MRRYDGLATNYASETLLHRGHWCLLGRLVLQQPLTRVTASVPFLILPGLFVCNPVPSPLLRCRPVLILPMTQDEDSMASRASLLTLGQTRGMTITMNVPLNRVLRSSLATLNLPTPGFPLLPRTDSRTNGLGAGISIYLFWQCTSRAHVYLSPPASPDHSFSAAGLPFPHLFTVTSKYHACGLTTTPVCAPVKIMNGVFRHTT